MQESGFISEVLFLGNRASVEDQARLSVRFFYPTQDLLHHIFLTGDPSSAKTLFGKTVVEELAQKRVPSIIFDLKGDLSSLALLVEGVSQKYLDLWKKIESDPKKAREMARQAFNNHLKQLSGFGFTEEYIQRIKMCTQAAIFTPKGGKGIPLAVSSFLNIPKSVVDVCKEDKTVLRSMAATLAQSLMHRLYKEQAVSKQKEVKFLIELVVHAWTNGMPLDGLAGLVRLTELVDAPPIEEIEGKLVDEYISSDERLDLTQRIYNFSVVEREMWYKGVPLDIDMLCYKGRDDEKANVTIINLSELENFHDRTFVINRTLYSIYAWMKGRGNAAIPKLFVYFDEIGGEKPLYPVEADEGCRHSLDLLLKEGENHGVACLLATHHPLGVDYKGLAACKTWIFGKISSDPDRAKVIEGAKEAGITFDRMEAVIKSLGVGEFAVKLRSGETVSVRKKCLASFHFTVPPLFLSRIIDQEVREFFKAYYISGTISGSEVLAQLQASDLTPRAIFNNFDFGSGTREQFVIDVEPDDAVMLCLKELAEEDISVKEIQFKNVQLILSRAHRAQWKVDTLIKNSLGQAMDHIKDEGHYTRIDSIHELDEVTREKVLETMDKPIATDFADICNKASIVTPDVRELTPREVRVQVSYEVNVPASEVQVTIFEQNVALYWKFTVEYRGKLVETNIDMVNRYIRTDFPSFSPQEAIDEIKRKYPDFVLTDSNVSSRVFYHIVNYVTPDKVYMFQVNRRSGKVIKEKITISEAKAREIAKKNKDEEPFLVRKYKNAWNFYYHSGVRLIVDEESGDAMFRDLVSAEAVDALAISAISTRTVDSNFHVNSKEFKDGKWFLKLSSNKWEVDMEMNEDARVAVKMKLRREYCLAEARKLMALYQIQVAMYNNADRWNDGWSFEFFSSQGDFIVRIDAQKSEFIKKRLTPEGIKHFVQLETGGSVVSVDDKEVAWDIIVKKEKQLFRVLLSKQDGCIKRIRVKKFIFWADVDAELFQR